MKITNLFSITLLFALLQGCMKFAYSEHEPYQTDYDEQNKELNLVCSNDNKVRIGTSTKGYVTSISHEYDKVLVTLSCGMAISNDAGKTFKRVHPFRYKSSYSYDTGFLSRSVELGQVFGDHFVIYHPKEGVKITSDGLVFSQLIDPGIEVVEMVKNSTRLFIATPFKIEVFQQSYSKLEKRATITGIERIYRIRTMNNRLYMLTSNGLVVTSLNGDAIDFIELNYARPYSTFDVEISAKCSDGETKLCRVVEKIYYGHERLYCIEDRVPHEIEFKSKFGTTLQPGKLKDVLVLHGAILIASENGLIYSVDDGKSFDRSADSLTTFFGDKKIHIINDQLFFGTFGLFRAQNLWYNFSSVNY